MAAEPSTSFEEFHQVLRNSKNIIAVAGAGLSAASGIPTFRGAGGLWRSYNALNLATPRAFEANPSRVWQFYHMRRQTVLRARPNSAHLALARLCLPKTLREVAPKAKFTLITQNVDGLSIQALEQVSGDEPTADGSSPSQSNPNEASSSAPSDTTTPRGADDKKIADVYEMHGRVLDTICTSCGHREHNGAYNLTPALGAANIDQPEVKIPLEDLPRCSLCGGLLRPGVVWFEERPRYLDEIDALLQEADLCLVIGTSSTVFPAAGYAYTVAENGGKVAVFNLEADKDEDADFLFLGPCEETLPAALFPRYAE